MIDLSLLQQFVAVAETENVGSAARRLHISASPLSRRVRQLEDQLGLTLFHRERQRLRLTREGRVFLDDARRFLAGASRLEARARDLGAGLEGTMRMGFVEGAVHAGVVPRALSGLRRSAPGVRVELVSLRSSAQLAGLQAGEIDAGFVYGPCSSPGIHARTVAVEPFVLVCAKDRGSSRWAPKRFSAEPFIALPEHVSPHSRRALLAACERVGLAPDVRYEVAEPSAVLRLVASGLGVAIVQASLASAPGIRAVRLPAAFGLEVEIVLVTPEPPGPLAARVHAAVTVVPGQAAR